MPELAEIPTTELQEELKRRGEIGAEALWWWFPYLQQIRDITLGEFWYGILLKIYELPTTRPIKRRRGGTTIYCPWSTEYQGRDLKVREEYLKIFEDSDKGEIKRRLKALGYF